MESFLYLPQDLVVEIMSWLPPESLIQFKCVNKSWYSLITDLTNDPTFVAKHLLNQNNKLFSSTKIAFSCLHIYEKPVYNFKELFSVLTLPNPDCFEEDHIVSTNQDLNLPAIPDEKDLRCVTVSECNGIVCLADYYDHIVLSNPAINQIKFLPKSCLGDRFVLQGVGFGYDSRADDYKVVRFGRDMTVYPRAELYSLNSDSWKEIDMDIDRDYFPSLNLQVYNNGVFYWYMSGPRNMICAFDMSDEAFQTIPLPDNLQAQSSSLGVWNDSLALFVCPGEKGASESLCIDIWLMNDCCSWSKKLTIGPLVGVDCPLGFWKNDELLMRATNVKQLVSYNVGTQKLRNLTIDGLDGIGCRAFSYVKSLVSLQGKGQAQLAI
ncbi:hypothetical protein UlMin_029152 [Ulmus minor]